MRTTITLAAFLVIVSFCTLVAQYGGDVTSESSAGNFFGIGARAVGMSEAVVVSSMDGSAVFYNPAGLVRIKRPEFLGALSHEKVGDQTGSASVNLNKTRFNSFDLSVPVPTYRGSMVIAFGVNRSRSFDRAYTFSLPSDLFGASSALEDVRGSIREWSAAGAVELSPRLSIGATLMYLNGKEDYFWDYHYPGPADAPAENRDDIQSRYSGVGARLGMIFEANSYLMFGVSVDSPIKFNIKQDYVQRTITTAYDSVTVGNYEYDLQQPFVFTGGSALRVKTLLVEADLGYADWSQLEYKGKVDLTDLNRQLDSTYNGALQIRIGAEYTVPRYGFVVRGGFKHDPLPFSGTQLSNQIQKDRNSFSLGLGYLIDRVAMLDVGYARANYTLYDGANKLTQKYTTDRVLVSIGYRI